MEKNQTQSSRAMVFNKVRVDMTTPAARVYWTDVERQTLLEALYEKFKEQKKPASEWEIDIWDIHGVQVEYFAKERRRDVLDASSISQIVSAVREMGVKAEIDEIVSTHFEFVKKHGMTPLEKIEEMLSSSNGTQDEVNRLTLKNQELTTSAERLTQENTALTVRAAELGESVASLTAQLKAARASLNASIGAAVLAKATVPPTPLPMFVGTNKLAQQHLKQLNAINPDIIFMDARDKTADIKRKAIGRVVIFLEGHMPSEYGKVARANAKEVVMVPAGGAGSMVISVVQERMLKHAAQSH